MRSREDRRSCSLIEKPHASSATVTARKDTTVSIATQKSRKDGAQKLMRQLNDAKADAAKAAR
jgi:hypothetical protein